MTAASKPLARLTGPASAHGAAPLLRRIARQAHAAHVSAGDTPTDAATDAALSTYLDRTRHLATLPAADTGDIAVKLASVLRLRLGDRPEQFDECQRAELALLTSALADLMILGEGLS